MPIMDGIEATRYCREVNHIKLLSNSDKYLTYYYFHPFLLIFQQVLQLRDLPILALSAEVGAKIKEEAVAGMSMTYHFRSMINR